MGDEKKIAKSILESMGCQDYDPNVITLLAEFLRRETNELLIDALEYAKYAGRRNIDLSDVRLASQARDASEGYNQSPIPQRDKILTIAEVINRSRPLEPIPADYGIKLPPIEHKTQGDELLATNYIAEGRKGGASAAAAAAAAVPPSASSSTDPSAAAPPPPRPAKRGEKGLTFNIS